MNADDLGKILDELGQRLGPAGEHVYSVLVKQAVVSGIVQVTAAIVVLALMTAAIVVTYKFAQHDAHRERTGYSGQFDPTGYLLLGGFVTVACVIFASVFFLLGVQALLNPEYQAIRDLLTRLP